MLNIAFIGFGTRSAYLWEKMFKPTGECNLVAIADPNWEHIKNTHSSEFPDCHYYATAEEMLESEKPHGVVIGTGCNLHTKYACLVAKYNIPLFLEKPVSIDEEQLEELERVLPTMNDKTVVSFPLRFTNLIAKVKEMLDSGCIGDIAQVQAVNNVYYGRCYYHGWYRDDSLTGGLWVTKATHDIDYLSDLIGQGMPISICATESKMVFKGDKTAGLLCIECAEQDSCPESPKNLSEGDRHLYNTSYCCFASDTGNHDSGTAIVQYKNGLHAVYTQNFIVRKHAGKRGARFIGLKGTLEFDFNTSEIIYIDHYSGKAEKIAVSSANGHGGGDGRLAQNFINVMKGTEKSIAPLEDGIMSIKVCLACKRSAISHTFEKP